MTLAQDQMDTNQVGTYLDWKLAESFQIICENTKHLDMPQSWKRPPGSLAVAGSTPSYNGLVFHLFLCFKISFLLFSHPRPYCMPGGVLFPLLTIYFPCWDRVGTPGCSPAWCPTPPLPDLLLKHLPSRSCLLSHDGLGLCLAKAQLPWRVREVSADGAPSICLSWAGSQLK